VNVELRHYIESVQADTLRYVQDLLEQIEKLESYAATVVGERDVLRGEKERLAGRYTQVERRSANLANLYVAAYRLHSTLERAEVLAAIQEIVVNLIGCEEVAVFEREGELERLSLVAGQGLAEDMPSAVPFGAGVIGRAAAGGSTLVVGPGEAALPHETGITACVPLKVGGRVTGAIAIFRLLGHKAGLEELDYELFELLGTHAATALVSSRLALGPWVAGVAPA
jgi:hypothetical protein